MLLNGTRREFAEGRLHLDCPKMELTQLGSTNPKKYQGPGFIRLDENQKLTFRLYDTASNTMETIVTNVNAFNKHKPGKLIEDGQYFSLSASDLTGRVWISNKSHIHNSIGSGGIIVFGEIANFELIQQRSGKSHYIDLWFRDARDLPGKSWTSKPITFMSCDCEFKIELIDGGMSVQLKSDIALPKHAETRVVEALQFVLGRTLWWCYMHKLNAGIEVCELRSERADLKAILDPPIRFDSPSEGQLVWPLFSQFLQNIWKTEMELFHPISGWLHFARSAHHSSLYTHGLALGVAIEGVLKSCFKDMADLPAILKPILHEATAHMATWTGDKTVKARVMGIIDTIQHPHVKNSLHLLLEKGTITQKGLKAWNTLRNKTAHATPPKEDDYQEWIDLIFSTELMLYQLIFATIHYAGPFTDYDSAYWPNGHFPMIKKAEEQATREK